MTCGKSFPGPNNHKDIWRDNKDILGFIAFDVNGWKFSEIKDRVGIDNSENLIG